MQRGRLVAEGVMIIRLILPFPNNRKQIKSSKTWSVTIKKSIKKILHYSYFSFYIILHIGLGGLGHLQDSTCIYDPYAFRVVNLQWLNIVFSLFKNHDTMYIKPWHPVYNAYMARLGHGMCHIEFTELLCKSILTIYIKKGDY